MPDLLTVNPTTRTRYTVADLRDRVLGDLGLRGNGLVTNQDIDRWALEAQDDIAEASRWYRLVDTFGVIVDTAEYDLPEGCLALEYLEYDGKPLASITLEEMYDLYPFWRSQSSGTPLYYYTRGGSSYGLYPTPAATSGSVLMIKYTALPPEPDGDEDFYFAPAGAESAIVAYCCFKASVKDAGGEGKLRDNSYAALWAASLRKFKRQVNGIDQNQPLIFGRGNLRRPYGKGVYVRPHTIPSP